MEKFKIFSVTETNPVAEIVQHVKFSSNFRLNGHKMAILVKFMNLLWGNGFFLSPKTASYSTNLQL